MSRKRRREKGWMEKEARRGRTSKVGEIEPESWGTCSFDSRFGGI